MLAGGDGGGGEGGGAGGGDGGGGEGGGDGGGGEGGGGEEADWGAERGAAEKVAVRVGVVRVVEETGAGLVVAAGRAEEELEAALEAGREVVERAVAGSEAVALVAAMEVARVGVARWWRRGCVGRVVAGRRWR